MAFDATPGGVATNSYVSISEADDYFELRLGTQAWLDADLATKQRALCHATIQLDRLDFKGVKMVPEQALKFPRYSTTWTRERGLGLPSATEVPLEVRRATMEEALWALKHLNSGGKSKRQELQEQGVTRFKIDGFEEDFGPGGSNWGLCPEARSHLKHWVLSVGEVLDPREMRLAPFLVANRFHEDD